MVEQDASPTSPAKDVTMGSPTSLETRSTEPTTASSPKPAAPSSNPLLRAMAGGGGGKAGEPRENKWKLALRQLIFMSRMNLQFTDRIANEIELRQQNISPTSLICSVPYFNSFSPTEIKELEAASKRERLRPGHRISLSCSDKIEDQQFYIVISGNLAMADEGVTDAEAVQRANLSPIYKLGIGDYFGTHGESTMSVLAMGPVEYLRIPMEYISQKSSSACTLIAAEKNEITRGTAEIESYKKWALQFAMSNNKASAAEAKSSTAQGIARVTFKAFTKEMLLHLSPECELDHTLEYMQKILCSAFGARKVRIYVVDHASSKLTIKYSEDRLSAMHVRIRGGIGEFLMSKCEPQCIGEASDIELATEKQWEDYYRDEDIVLVAPFFQYDPTAAKLTNRDPSAMIGVLEVVIGQEIPRTMSQPPPQGSIVRTAPPSPSQFNESDAHILETATQELGRYLYFHYNGFFSAPNSSIVSSSDTPSTNTPPAEVADAELEVNEVFPTPEPDASLSASPIIISLGDAAIRSTSKLTHVLVMVGHGKTTLSAAKLSMSATGSGSDGARTYRVEGDGDLGISVGDIPHGAHVMIQFVASVEVVAWSGMHLFDFGHGLKAGKQTLAVSSATSRSATALEIENCSKPSTMAKTNIGTIEIEVSSAGLASQPFSFSSFQKKRSMPFRASIFFDQSRRKSQEDLVDLDTLEDDKKALLKRLRSDPLVHLSSDDTDFLWRYRQSLTDDAALLPAFLSSVDWSKRDRVMEAYRLLLLWRQPSYLQALQLLSPMFPDPKVRAYAVRCMHSLQDQRLRLYLLQLVQALKNERYHDSALARFLLMRGLLSPGDIGYSLYWFLKAEAHVDQTSERFETMMAQYLQLCGSYKLEIRQSVFVMKKLEEVAAVVKQEATPKARKEKLHEELRKTLLPDTFQLPLHPRTFCTKVIIDKCRVMESKKKPLFLQLENAKALHQPPYVIFKSGDDLRQDQLVLQILRVMDDLWREAGLNLCLSPYACISTGDELGLIEVVDQAETLASIIYNRHRMSLTKIGRKMSAAKDALVGGPVISDWLFQQPPPPPPSTESAAALPPRPTSPVREEDVEIETPSIAGCFPLLRSRSRRDSTERNEELIQTFVKSCAGYCVATYVLGIGDRHNDNLMLQVTGKLFHIDFGHFLGNFKTKLGVKRERAPFVFTPAMLDVMGGKDSEHFEKFKSTACQAFQVLRHHSNLLITLLVLALSCGIPELTSETDIRWVHKTLMLELSDEEAEKKFRKLILVALHTKTTHARDAAKAPHQDADVIEEQQRQVLRVRKGSDLAVYGNESSNYQNRKWSMEETVTVDEENENQWTSNPHTLTCGFLMTVWITYEAFYGFDETGLSDDEIKAQTVRRGIKFACAFFLSYCMLQLPDGHFVRPHPIVWRLVTGVFILYEMLLIFLLFMRTDDARQFMTNFDPKLGVKLPETSYATDCRLYTPEHPESNFVNFRNTFFDRFVVMHFVGWFVGALMVRSYLICWILSIMFEVYELTFRHWLANFNECWWDHLFLDLFTCNAFGIYLGMKVCRWFEMKKFNWVGIRKIPNLSGKAKRALAQFTPMYWLAYDWKIFRSAERFWRVMSMVTILSIMMLNSFFLKTVLWVPASSTLNVIRLCIWYSAGSYAVAEYYIFCTFTLHCEGVGQTPVKKLGPRAWLGLAVVITEVLIIIKHGKGMFTAPFPTFVKVIWSVLFLVLVVGSTIYFKFFNQPQEQKAVDTKVADKKKN
ncbi:TPA: hypothetical protein N0F65_009395 [Lagenidium giganteum]|uniref:phosphatidylinositol 3-kinase n=1 Tax=Lagenidium giganteum TaxID=4803 RepID=A0AAV2Z9D4_9STRA|nr:TPA: hypothetical protein N0F65_009395 [Lagenidium giganteum]